MQKKLRIGINAQIPEGSGAGGIETVVRVLTALNRFGADEEYVFITHPTADDWLKPLLGARQTTVRAPHYQAAPPPPPSFLRRASAPLRPLARMIKNRFAPAAQFDFNVPVSDGFYESLKCDVIHFPYQDYVRCRVPTVYNPHDLQHLHFPEFFTAQEIRRREIVYPTACRAAEIVVTASEFVKRDIEENYQVDAAKIAVIQWALPESKSTDNAPPDAEKTLAKYDCPRPFALYPAMTWEHKNHLRLLEAVALLRDRERLTINLVCTGHRNSFYPTIERRLRELNLENQIRFTDVVEYQELNLFYRLARFVVIPTLFEAASAPLFEAWQNSVAVACSSVTALPEQAADAALLFDPQSVGDIAGALKKMWTDADFRRRLIVRGTRRLTDFSLERMAKNYRAVYRRAAGFAPETD